MRWRRDMPRIPHRAPLAARQRLLPSPHIPPGRRRGVIRTQPKRRTPVPVQRARRDDGLQQPLRQALGRNTARNRPCPRSSSAASPNTRQPGGPPPPAATRRQGGRGEERLRECPAPMRAGGNQTGVKLSHRADAEWTPRRAWKLDAIGRRVTGTTSRPRLRGAPEI